MSHPHCMLGYDNGQTERSRCRNRDFLECADGNAFLQATVIKQTIAMRDFYYVSPAFHGSSTARDDVGTLIQTCFSKDPSGSQTVDQFIEKSFADAVKKLAKRYDK